jgi:3-hydroxyacyl-[acyl-carrier-protein] dehydratase
MSRWTNLDRIVSIEPGQRAVALRNVPNTLAIFDSHFPRFPVLPGVLILGSLGSLACQLLESDAAEHSDALGHSDAPGQWRFAGADRVGFRHFVRPGDQLELTVELKERTDAEAVLSGEAKVDELLVTRARRLRLVRIEQ